MKEGDEVMMEGREGKGFRKERGRGGELDKGVKEKVKRM